MMMNNFKIGDFVLPISDEYSNEVCELTEDHGYDFKYKTKNGGFGYIVKSFLSVRWRLATPQEAKVGHRLASHNTSCTYRFELAFHNLQDTPELRKIYWSALGQLQFDSNDQVIPPELEECPCCKGNQDA